MSLGLPMNRLTASALSLLFCTALAASLTACKTSALGACQSDADCAKGSACDTAQPTPVCVVPEGGCFPACPDGEACKNAQCVPPICDPGCSPAQLCDTATATCKDATVGEVHITSPAAGAFAGPSLKVTASAHAPGGVSALKIELRRPGTLLAQADGTATPTTADPANFAATLALTSVSEGTAQLVAVATTTGGAKESAPVNVLVDAQPPAITMVTDGRTEHLAFGATATISAQLTDSAAGSGTAGTQAAVVFLFGTHAPLTALVSEAGAATFTVQIDEALAADGQNTTMAFRVEGTDKAGNAAVLSGGSEQVLLIDRLAPTGTVTTDALWHAQTETVPVSGSVTDTGGSLVGGAAKFELLKGDAVMASGGFNTTGGGTSGNWTSAIPLATLTVPAIEAAWAFQVRLTDAAGNTALLNSAINIDALAPRITQVQVSTPPDAPTGPGYYKVTGTALGVHAFLQDVTGFDGGVCLRVAGEEVTCPHAGATIDGGTWTFSMARPGNSAPLDGTTPVDFTIEATDGVAARMLPADRPTHLGTSAPTPVYYDNVGPSIAIPTDAKVYPRTAADGGAQQVSVAAQLSDAVGVDDAGTNRPKCAVSGNGAHFYQSQDGGTFVFNVSGTEAIDAGTEGPATFVITAVDLLGNTSTASGTRTFDDQGPTLASLTITRADQAVAGPSSGVNIVYPDAITGTGYDGFMFYYGDTVRVQGQLTDLSSVAPVAAFTLNGTYPDGGPSLGVSTPISCDGGPTCAFDVTMQLNGADAGEFHTAFANAISPDGPMTVALTANDLSTQPDGNAATHSALLAQAFDVTRLWWTATIANLTTINGLALHPNGALIVTGAGAAGDSDTVVALNNDGPWPASGAAPKAAVQWTWGQAAGTGAGHDQPLGDVPSAATIGLGTANDALIYVAALSQTIVALHPNGLLAWQQKDLDAFAVSPTVARVDVDVGAGPLGAEVVFVPSSSAATLWETGAFADGSTVIGSTASDDSTTSSSPIYLADAPDSQGAVYFGSDTTVAKHVILTTGPKPADVQATNNSLVGPFWSLLSDGTNVLAPQLRISSGTGRMRVLSTAMVTLYDWNYAPNGASGRFSGETIVDLSGNLLVGTRNGKLQQVATSGLSRGTYSTFYDYGSSAAAAHAPLIGSNGHVYTPRRQELLVAFAGTQPSWYWDPTPAIHSRVTMDCDGHLFSAAGNEVRAFLADDRGLGNSAWPAPRRDSRNTANVTATRYGVRLANGTCTQ